MTDRWTRRIAEDDMSSVIDAARAAGVITADTRSLVFHDLDLLDGRLSELIDRFAGNTIHTVAIKANPVIEVLRVVVDRGCGLEAASYEEVELALAAGCDPQRIVFDSPAKTFAEIRASLELGIRINADSIDEIDRIAALRHIDSSSVVGLRVNPLVGAGSIGTTSVASSDSKFGVPVIEGDASVVDIFESNPWLRGLHVHVGSQGCTLDQLAAAARVVSGLRSAVHHRVGRHQIDHVDIGGGLPVSYGLDDDAPTLVEYVDRLHAAVPELFSPDTTIVTEFGRAVHAGCGWAVSRVEYVKEGAVPTAVLHLGADFLMRPVYQPEFWSHRFSAPGGNESSGDSPWRLAGPLCFGGDIIGRDVSLPEVRAGDLIAVHDVGAYTLSMWSRHCSRAMPEVVGYRNTGRSYSFTTLRRAETSSDIVRLWSREMR